MPRRDVADVTLQHLLLADLLPFVLRAVIVILMDHGAAAVMPELRGCHRWALPDNGPGISRCARRCGSFWGSALSSNAGIVHEGNGATGPRYGYGPGTAPGLMRA